MTQTMFAPPPVMDPPVEETAAGGTRRTALIAGGLAAAVALAGGGYFLLGGGSDTTPSSAPAVRLPVHVVKPVVKKATTKTPVKPAAKVPATSTVPIGRDPFHALYIAPVAAPAGSTPAGSTSTSTTTSSTSSSSSTTTPVANAAYGLKLLSISGTGNHARFFTFSVGGVKKVVISGQKFGKYGELVALTWVTNSTGKNVGAIVQVGDDNPIGVKIGEQISVQ